MPRAARVSKTDINVLPLKPGQKPPYRFVVTGPQPGGRRWRKYFEVRPKAEAFAQLKRVDLANHGVQGVNLTMAERTEYLEAKEALAAHGVSLREAVALLLPQLEARNRTVPVVAAVKELLATRRADGASSRYLLDLSSRLGRFAADFGERPIATLAGPEVDAWLRGLPQLGAISRNNYRRVLGVLFAFALDRGWTAANPIPRVPVAKQSGGRIGILTPEELTRLLELAPPATVPALAIGAFAGLRAAELARLDWSEVKLSRGLVEVTAAKAKSARRRFVPIRENLAAWLTPHARASGPVCPSGWVERFVEARAAAGLAGKKWPHNALRHSFASYHAAHFQDAGKLAAELGHTTPGIVFQHYRELVDPADAARFWQVAPPAAPANVVPMRAERTA